MRFNLGFKVLKHTVFWLENLNERDHVEDLGVEGIIILKLTLKM